MTAPSEPPGDEPVGPLAGVRVVEVASHVFVPTAGGVLAEWGADVVKVEHPVEGDPFRGLVTAGLNRVHNGVDVRFQATNRGKRSVALDLKHPEGRALLSRLVERCDVFLTNLRAGARTTLGIDVDDIRRQNPRAIYVRGTAFGARGPDAGRGGYDAGAYWARSGMQHLFTDVDDDWPASPRPAFGDVVGGLHIAGAVAAALYRRSTTGVASVVDVSLLAAGLWQIQSDVVNAQLGGSPPPYAADRYRSPNPLMLAYRTEDDRFLSLQMLSPDRRWPQLCQALGQPEMATDPRFVDHDVRRANARACIEWLEGIFVTRDLATWRRILAADFDGEWVPIVEPGELAEDAQVRANGYLAAVEVDGGGTVPVVASPAQFDERPNRPTRAPEHGEHTEAELLDLGLGWDDIVALKESRAIR